jgi:CheY-like chemotaxis protein
MIPAALFSILVAEDDESDVIFLRRAFKVAGIANPLHVVADGQEAIDYLARSKSFPAERLPALVMLDLKMPRRGGLQVLRWIREEPIIRCLPVMILSSSENRNDIESAYDGGANAYMIKPPSLAEQAEVARFIKEWLRLIRAPLASVEGFRAAQTQRAGQ